jgi:hypothetical protein
VAALVASLLVLGAGYAAVSRPDPSEVAVADTADGEEAASTTTRVTTTITAPVETIGPETAPPPEPAPDPTDPTTPTTAVVLPSAPAPGAARPTISPPRPTTTTRPTPPPSAPATTARPPDPSVCVAGGGCPGRAYWTSNDDRLHVCDATSDGYVVVAEYRRSDATGTGRLASPGGDRCTDTRLDLRSGATVTFRACLENRSGDPSRCSAWVTGQS